MKAIDTPKARNNELAQIHIAVADLGWSDADYRAILKAKTGKASAGDLDSTSRKRFLEHLRACGWRPKHKGPRLTPQQWRIKQMWRELGEAGALQDKSEKALNTFIKNLVATDDLRFVGTAQAVNVVEALKAWMKRSTKKG